MNFKNSVTKSRILLFVSLLLLGSYFVTNTWAQNGHESAYQQGYGQGITNTPEPGSWFADSDDDLRSKAEVMREVKKRYDARVLKISLNKKREIYRVRLLMPDGKVRNITVSARR